MSFASYPLPASEWSERWTAWTSKKGARQAVLLNGAQILIAVEAAYRPGYDGGMTYLKDQCLFENVKTPEQVLRTPLFLPLHCKNILGNLLLIGIGQFQKPASVFKPGAPLFNDTHDLSKHSRFRPVLQQPDLQ